MDSRLVNPITVIRGNGDDQHLEVSSINQLDEVLDRVQGCAEQGQPPIVDVEVPDQGVMRIGCSAQGSIRHEFVFRSPVLQFGWRSGRRLRP